MSDFNLRQLVREVLRTSVLADPTDVAVEVMRRIPKNMIRVALEQVLREVVRNVMAEERAASRVNTSVPQSPAHSGRSSKVAGIRDGWQRRLRDRVHVGASEWKLLGSCTYEDLLFAASERRELAEQNAAVARQYDAWARLINEHGVGTFGELPAETQMQALGVAA